MEIKSSDIDVRRIEQTANSCSDEAVALLKQLKTDRLQFKALVFVLLLFPISWATIPFVKLDFAGESLLNFYVEIVIVNLAWRMIVWAGLSRKKYNSLTATFFIVSYIAAQLAAFQVAIKDDTFRILPAWLTVCFLSWLMSLFPCGIIFIVAKLSKALAAAEGSFTQRLRRELYLLTSNKENEVMLGFTWTGFVWLFMVGSVFISNQLNFMIRSSSLNN